MLLELRVYNSYHLYLLLLIWEKEVEDFTVNLSKNSLKQRNNPLSASTTTKHHCLKISRHISQDIQIDALQRLSTKNLTSSKNNTSSRQKKRKNSLPRAGTPRQPASPSPWYVRTWARCTPISSIRGTSRRPLTGSTKDSSRGARR